MKTICTYENAADAGFAQSVLEPAGIGAVLFDEDPATEGPASGRWRIGLQVPEDDVERALELLAAQGALDAAQPVVTPDPESPVEPVTNSPVILENRVLDITCPTCGTKWELTPQEAGAGTFTCDECKSTFPIIDLLSIEDAWETVVGFPHPKWRRIREYINQHYSPSDQSEIWQQAPLQWVNAIRQVLGLEYRIHQSKNFLILTTKSPDGAKFTVNVCENALMKIRSRLGALAWHWKSGKHVVFLFEDVDLYYRYISYFYPEEGEFIRSGGIFLNRGYCHTALPPCRDPAPVLIHELTHLSLAHLRIPKWLNEGLAVDTEEFVNGRWSTLLGEELTASHERHWNGETIQDFWNGNSFSRPDESEVSYSLARILVANMRSDFPNFDEFINEAKASDAGESSAMRHLGVSLNVVAATFLGEGDWTPRSIPNQPES